ncbi:MAG: hypothetical protein AABW83_01520 [Nanoarchaeota archaeon]
MNRSIEDFVNTLPEVNGCDEAKSIFQEATDINIFPRIELYGAHRLSQIGIQMVYVIGRSKISYDGKVKDSLFYSPCMMTDDFFGKIKQRNADQVNAITLDRIKNIRQLYASTENSYSRSAENDS